MRRADRLVVRLAALATLLSALPAAAQDAKNVLVPDGMQYVSSIEGSVYYWTGPECENWRRLSAANVRFFRTRAEAEAFDGGRAPSRSRGCAGPGAGAVRSAAPGAPIDLGPPASGGRCTVREVDDGDTFTCGDGTRVRLLLVDAPELSQAPFGAVAQRELERLIPPGTTVLLETDIAPLDRYRRLLAYVALQDGRPVNEALLRSGLAVVVVYPPNVARVDRFRAIADSARTARRGLWSTSAFECRPADHRAGRCLPFR